MLPSVRLFGTDKEEITSLESWFSHAPPEGGLAQWTCRLAWEEEARSALADARCSHIAQTDIVGYAVARSNAELRGLRDAAALYTTGCPESRRDPGLALLPRADRMHRPGWFNS